MTQEEKIKSKRQEQQHEELTGLLKKVLLAIEKDNGADGELAKLLAKNNGNIDVFLGKLKEVATPIVEAPDVNVNVDMDKLAGMIADKLRPEFESQAKREERIIELLSTRATKMEAKRYNNYGNSPIQEVKITYDKINS